ncbi:hypothetical protein V7S43_015687 [Phytophthora oleae]|uniref:Uncharacterized protein n=1 Tax=Phytophthora oleae TaxID=2107226 RepID=A0ABD3EYY8_9STRA
MCKLLSPALADSSSLGPDASRLVANVRMVNCAMWHLCHCETSTTNTVNLARQQAKESHGSRVFRGVSVVFATSLDLRRSTGTAGCASKLSSRRQQDAARK